METICKLKEKMRCASATETPGVTHTLAIFVGREGFFQQHPDIEGFIESICCKWYKIIEAQITNLVGISTFSTEILPKDKAEKVERLKKRNKQIAMANDEIHDAPARATMYTDCTVSTGPDIAIETSDITLLRNNMRNIADAISFSKVFFSQSGLKFFAFFNVGVYLAARPTLRGRKFSFIKPLEISCFYKEKPCII